MTVQATHIFKMLAVVVFSYHCVRCLPIVLMCSYSGMPRRTEGGISVFKIDVVSLALRLRHHTAQIYMHFDESLTFLTHIILNFWIFWNLKLLYSL